MIRIMASKVCLSTLNYLAALDDDLDLSKISDVFERIALEDQKISQLSLFDGS